MQPRTTTLGPDTEASPTIDVGRPWWAQRRPWPPGMRFEDVSPAELEFEHLADSSPVPLPEPPITSTGALCVEASLAEPEVDPAIDGVGFMPLRALLRRRAHPLDRRAACRAVGAAV